MQLKDIKKLVHVNLYQALEQRGIGELRPSQEKSISAGLLEGHNLLVCTPTGSGKTLVAEIAAVDSILRGKGKAIYIVPLKALASEKYKEFKERYGKLMNIALSMGDMDSSDHYLKDYDLIITTSEKLDSLTRHHTPWLKDVYVVVVDEIHLLNDPGRGPTLEILITQPERFRIMSLERRLVRYQVLRILVATILSKSASLALKRGASTVAPALLTRTSSGPASFIASNIRSTPSSVERSAETTKAPFGRSEAIACASITLRLQ